MHMKGFTYIYGKCMVYILWEIKKKLLAEKPHFSLMVFPIGVLYIAEGLTIYYDSMSIYLF